MGAARGMIFEPNMVGTLSEAFDAARLARDHGYMLIPSGRSGGSADDPIPDIAVAVGARMAKKGVPRSSERTAGHNRLMRIEEELGAYAEFAVIK